MARFKLLAGLYVGFDKEAPRDAEGRYPNKTYTAGSIVESDDDLVEKHGYQKFAYVGESKAKNISRTPGDKSPGLNPQSFPGGQVSSGHQETTSLEDGQTKSGPASEEVRKNLEEQEAEANDKKANAIKSQPNPRPGILPEHQQRQDQQKKVIPPIGVPAKVDNPLENLDKMTVIQLREYAEDNEINVGSAKNKDELIKAIRSGK